MQPTALFYILIAILIINFIVDKILDSLNSKHFNDDIPQELTEIWRKKATQNINISMQKRN